MATLSVFHPGELHVQRTAGTRGVADELGAFLGTSIDVHLGVAALFGKLRYAWLSLLLPDERTNHAQHISVVPVFGQPGFISLQSDTHLLIRLDAAFCKTYIHLSNALPTETDSTIDLWISFLAIDLSTRRRYRTNGTVKHFDRTTNTLHVIVKEAFPNCPKYINIRTIKLYTHTLSPNVETTFTTSDALTDEDCAIISNADTFFLGSYYVGRGTDINHRGGKPGFLRVVNDHTLWWPDYRGNGMFQSIGNIHCDDRAGLTVLDFPTGRLLMLFGRAEILWEPPAEYTVESASQRIVRFRVERVRRSLGAVTDLRWNMTELSPYNPDLPLHTTAGASTNSTDTTGEGSTPFPVRVRLVKITTESDSVKTFRFLSPKTVQFLPGQYATFEFDKVDGVGTDVIRTWTLSEVANSTRGDVTLEVSVKRKTGGLISNWLHDTARLGLCVTVRGIDGDMTPFGEETETETEGFPSRLLLVSAGVGITPNMAILRGIGARFDDDSEKTVDVVMMHQDRQMASVPFLSEIDRRAGAPAVRARVFVTKGGGDGGGEQQEMMRHVSVKQGRMGETDLTEFVDGLRERVVYLCGPPGFMRDVSAALVNQGVAADKIITEKFDF